MKSFSPRPFHLLPIVFSALATLLPTLGPAPAAAQSSYHWTHFAGRPGISGNGDGTGSAAHFVGPSGIAADSAGNVYVADIFSSTLRKVTPAGVVSTLAGAVGERGDADGSGPEARFSSPCGVAVDSSGNIYVADTDNHSIRKVTPAGVVTTFAGTAGMSGGNDGTGANARFEGPRGLAVDASGNLYVADWGNSTIRKVTPGGVVSTLAGLAGEWGDANGTGANARFRGPSSVALDSNENVYVADSFNHTIRKVTQAGVVTTFAGSSGYSGFLNGTGTGAFFNKPNGVTVGTDGNLYVGDSENNLIRRVTPGRVVTTLAGTVWSPDHRDGTGAAARFHEPRGMTVDGGGNIYVADTFNSTIRKVTTGGVVTSLAGSNGRGSADGPGSVARFKFPGGVAVDEAGIVYIADSSNYLIRRVSPEGDVTTLAGVAGEYGSSDGSGAAARFSAPEGVAVDGAGDLYVADSYNNTIRKVTPSGVVSTLAGSAGNAGSANGTGTAARFNLPKGVAVDGDGNVYVADTDNHTLRKVTPGGLVTTLAGSAGIWGSTNGTGSAARFHRPNGVAVDRDGNVYVADSANNLIRKVTPGGVVTTFAGIAGEWGSEDGSVAVARFQDPQGVAVDSVGNVFVADYMNNTIRMVTPEGEVTTIGGLPNQSGNKDGVGTDSRFVVPRGVATGPGGTVFVVDPGTHRITRGTPGGEVVPTVATAAASGVTSTTATTGGDVVSDGGATPTERGIVYSTEPDPTLATGTRVTSGSGMGGFSVGLSGLNPSTTYFVRAYAINTTGTGYGSQISFTTQSIPATPLSNNVPLTGRSGTAGSVAYFVLSVPVGQASLTVQTSGGTGDCDLYVRRAEFPTLFEWDGSSTSSGNDESVEISNPQAGNYYIMLHAFQAYSGVSLIGTYTDLVVTLPSVVTSLIDTITTKSAVTGGYVTSSGGATVIERGVVYDTAEFATVDTGTKVVSGSGLGSFTANLSGLASSTTYYVRAYATNSVGIAYGPEFSFDTLAQPNTIPSVSTSTVTGVTHNSAATGGNVTSAGGTAVTERGVVYATVQSPTIETSLKVVSGNGIGSFTASLSGLAPATTYFVRAYATNSAGTAYGEQVSFDTLPEPITAPSVTTGALNAVSHTGATTQGEVTSSGGAPVTERGVVYAMIEIPDVETDTKVVSGSGPGSFTANLSGLAPATTYFVRAYATNSAGTAYGTQVSFETHAQPLTVPSVTTSEVIGKTYNSATVGGNVFSSGGAAVIERGVVYATSQNPTVETGTKVTSGSGTGSFTTLLNGLSPETGYYVRAYAINNAGTAYGTEVSFQISALPLITALDGVGLSWGVGGNAPWSGQTAVTSDSNSAAASGIVNHGEQSWIETTVTGPGTVSFRWKVSSEEGKDFLRFLRSGVEQFSISGEVNWEERIAAIPAGVHTLRWAYVRDESGSVGSDRGWLDQVSFSTTPPAAPALTVVGELKAFPATEVGRQSRAQNLRIFNGGGSPLSGLRITIDGKSKRDFLILQPARKSLAPGIATTFRATFRPRSKGSRNATLTVTSNAPSVQVAISGRGLAKKK